MDSENTNNDLVVSPDTISADDKIKEFIDNLGIDIDPKKLGVALCHRSYIFEKNSAVKLEHLKLMELLGFSLLRLIACTKRFTDSISDKQLSVALESDRQNIGLAFYKYYELCNIIRFGKGEQTNHKEFYKDVTSQVLFAIYDETDFYQLYKILEKFFMDLQIRIDYKTGLRNYVQKLKQIPQYEILREFGSDHAKQFEVELTVMSQTVRAVGRSKKIAEQEAAKLFVLKNNLQITENTNAKIESSPLRLGSKWDLNENRKKQLIAFLNQLGLDQSQLPLYMLDACFTHKSFLFENSWAVGETFDNLSVLGSDVLMFVIDLELKKYFDTVCQGLVGRLASLKAELISSDNLSKLFRPDWLLILKRGNGVVVLESKEAKSNIVQAIVGAIFLNAFQNKVEDPFNIVSKVVNRLIPIHREIELDDDNMIDYNSWLNTFNTALGLELYQTKMLKEGPDHKPRFIVGLKVFHPLSNDMDFAGEGTGVSRKEATRQASKKIFERLKMNFNLSDYSIYSNSQNWQYTLSKLISIAIKPGSSQQNNLELIGGLCLKTWSDTAATNILNNLFDNMLFLEIRKVYKLWVENSLSEKADAVICNHSNANELIELIFFKREVREDSMTNVGQFELEIEIEQQLEKNQNVHEEDEAEEQLNPILDEGSETIEEVMAKEQEVEIEKLIEAVKIDDETKLERQETLQVEKSLEIEIKTTIDRNYIQQEIDKSIDIHRNQYSGSQAIPQNPIDKVNMETKVTNINMVISKSNKTKEKNRTDKIQTHQIAKPANSNKVKLHKVHSRILRFSSEQCPYCGEKLNNYNRIFSVNQKTEAKYIESSVKCCLVCDICGLTEIGITKLSERGFSPQFYQGSPTFFQSTVLTKALSSENIIQISLQEHGSATVQKIEEDEPLDLDEIINGVPTKRRRVVTPEKLTETMERNNRIGLAGEKYVLEWEKGYLEKIGRSDLAKQIIWEAQRNCAAGYDILSCNPDGTPKYIEVKSTSGDKMPFYISANEWEWAKYLGHQYSIYRVFNVFGTPYIEKFDDPINLYQKDKIKLTPTSFRATLT